MGTPETPTTDAQWQALLTRKGSGVLPAEVTSGDYTIGTTLVSDITEGAEISGAGGPEWQPSSGFQGLFTRLIAANGVNPLFRLRGTYAKLAKMILYAGATSSHTQTAVAIEKGAGLGTGKSTFDELSYSLFDVCYWVDWTDVNQNCDDLLWRGRHVMQNCKTFCRLNGSQNLEYIAEHLLVREGTPSNIFHIFGGGVVKIRTLIMIAGATVFRFDSSVTGSDVARNNDYYVLENLKIDDQSNQNFKLVVTETNSVKPRVVLAGGVAGGDSLNLTGVTWVDLAGSGQIEIRDWANWPALAVKFGTPKPEHDLPRIHFINCRGVPKNPRRVLSTDSQPGSVTYSRCYLNDDTPLPDRSHIFNAPSG